MPFYSLGTPHKLLGWFPGWAPTSVCSPFLKLSSNWLQHFLFLQCGLYSGKCYHLRNPRCKGWASPSPTLSSAHLPHWPIDLHCQDFLNQCLKSRVLVDSPWRLPHPKDDEKIEEELTWKDTSRLQQNCLESARVVFLHKIHGHLPSLSFLYCSQFPSVGRHPLSTSATSEGWFQLQGDSSNNPGNWSERCRQRGPLHSSLFTRSMYPIKGF